MNGPAEGSDHGITSESDRALVEELLQITEKDIDGPYEPKIPRRNTKGDIISQIWRLKDTANLPMEFSETALRRMSKSQLIELLATQIEEASKKALASLTRAASLWPL